MGDAVETLSRDPRVSPRLTPTLTGVVLVILGVGLHDFLDQDILAFAAALRAANVPLLLSEYPTLNHGPFSYTAVSRDSLAAAEQRCDGLREQLT